MSIAWRTQDPPGERIIVSFVTLRRIVGALGMALPFAVMIETWVETRSFAILPSISASYDHQARDLFVGILFTIAWFLGVYRGHERKDELAGNAACVFALGVALVPYDAPGYLWAFHYLFATALFLTLAYFSMRLFTKTGGTPDQMTAMKVKRNKLYLTCGWVMLGAIVAMVVYTVTGARFTLGPVPVIFLLETVALEAFGISWMVKGETLWKDRGT